MRGRRSVFLRVVEDDLWGFRGNRDSHSLWQTFSLFGEIPNEDVERLIRRRVLHAFHRDYSPFGQHSSLWGDEYKADGLALAEHWCLRPGVKPLRFRDADRGVVFDLK